MVMTLPIYQEYTDDVDIEFIMHSQVQYNNGLPMYCTVPDVAGGGGMYSPINTSGHGARFRPVRRSGMLMYEESGVTFLPCHGSPAQAGGAPINAANPHAQNSAQLGKIRGFTAWKSAVAPLRNS